MSKWKVSEFSKLTGVSVRTLHHYDHIGLLKASERQPNGFRLYGEKDLQVILQILSLKFLGFELSAIKGLLDKSIPAQERFLIQKKMLDKKIDKLTKASKILKDVAGIIDFASLDLVLKLIEMYRMSHQLEKTKVRKPLPKPLLEKSTDYKGQIYAILQQVGTVPNDKLFKLCTQLLEEVYKLVPDTMRHQKDAILVNTKIASDQLS